MCDTLPVHSILFEMSVFIECKIISYINECIYQKNRKKAPSPSLLQPCNPQKSQSVTGPYCLNTPLQRLLSCFKAQVSDVNNHLVSALGDGGANWSIFEIASLLVSWVNRAKKLQVRRWKVPRCMRINMLITAPANQKVSQSWGLLVADHGDIVNEG